VEQETEIGLSLGMGF